jgi:uncharacterized protein (TIGR03118 family)
MHTHTMVRNRPATALGHALALCLTLMVGPPALWAAGMNSYTQHNLVSDGYVRADHTDPNLVNAWGLAFNPHSDIWVTDTGSGLSTLYDSAGNPVSLVVKIPGGSPTGIVYNTSPGFVIHKGVTFGASTFIFASESGRISGWNYNVDSTHAITMVDNGTSGAIYKGLAIIDAGGSVPRIYATDFHHGRIDVFDLHFGQAYLQPGAFTDHHLPKGFAPFGIQAIDGKLYVTYAKQDRARQDEIDGAGLGYVDVYNANGRLLRRLVSRGHLNAPWGLAKAPADFGRFSHSLLVANFGDGTIDAYSITSGRFEGQLKRPDHRPLKIDGLWGIRFGNGQRHQPINALFFAAGPDHEKHGLYGRIDAKVSQGKATGGNTAWPMGSGGYGGGY